MSERQIEKKRKEKKKCKNIFYCSSIAIIFAREKHAS